MLRILIQIAIILMLTSTIFASEKAPLKSINWDELYGNYQIIGLLGKPLGEIVEIKGVILPDDFRRSKGDLGKTLIKVSEVNGKHVSKSKILVFKRLCTFGLEEPAVGEKVHYIGYETGGYAGIPHKAFEYIMPVTSAEFSFSVEFVVLKKK